MNCVTLRCSVVLTCKTKHQVFPMKGKGVHNSEALVPACPRRSSKSARLAHLSKSDGRLVNVRLCSPSHSESAVVITESRWDHDLASHSAPSSGATKPSLSRGLSVLWGGKDNGTLGQMSRWSGITFPSGECTDKDHH